MNETERARLRIAIAQIMGWEYLDLDYVALGDKRAHRSKYSRQYELESWLNKVGIESVGEYFINVEKDFWVSVCDWKAEEDISVAWQVLEHFEWPGNYTRLQRTVTGKWRCDIELRGGDGPVRSAFDENVCIAICKAAYFAATGKEWQ